MELFSCTTRPRHPFQAAYSQRKVNTFLLLQADLPSALQVLAVLIGFSCAEKNRKASFQRTLEQINQSHIFVPCLILLGDVLERGNKCLVKIWVPRAKQCLSALSAHLKSAVVPLLLCSP